MAKDCKKVENVNPDLYQEVAVEGEDTGTVIMKRPFNPNKITIDLKSPPIFNLIDRMKQNPPEIDLYTEFQRRDDLWDAGKQSRLIESILIKFPLPAFYFDATDDDKWLVVDGLQRLSALRNFIIKKTLKLTGLEFLKDLEGKVYEDLPRSFKRIIDVTQVTAHIINPGTPPAVKFNIFKRINTGGLVLEPQEIRHALNQGIPANFVGELADSIEFKKATDNKISPSRMLDREFATRFVAFYLTPAKDYEPDLDSFLNNAMEKISKVSLNDREKIKAAFIKAMDTSHKVFGEWAFRKADKYPERRKPISKALFEIWAVNIAKLTDRQNADLIAQKNKVQKQFAKLCKDQEFWNSITYGTSEKNKVVYRFKKIQELISGVLGDR
jgi:hypothetical protein